MYMQPSFDIPTLALSDVLYKYLCSIINIFLTLCMMVKSKMKIHRRNIMCPAPISFTVNEFDKILDLMGILI